MRYKLLLLIFFISIYFFACQKELRLPEVPIDVPPGKLLVKITGIKGDSSIVTDFSYDTANRIISQKRTNTYHTNTTISFNRYYRDLSGRISKIAAVINHNSSATDTVYTYVYYPNSSTPNYNYTTSHFGILGTTAKDSTVFIYTGGIVVSSLSYLTNSLQSQTNLNSKCDYNYDLNGNLTEKKLFSYSRNSFIPVADNIYYYDNSINPLAIGNECILINAIGNGSKNNLRQIESKDFSDTVNSYTITRTYALNKATKPDKCYEKKLSDSTFIYSYLYH